MNESDVDFTASIFDPDGFKQRVADEMGLDSTTTLTITCLGGTMYRVDFSVGKYHANAVALDLSCEQARGVANWFTACIRKWYKQDEEQKNWDSSFKQLSHPNTWEKFAEWVDEYMQLPKGSVKYKEETASKIVEVPPTILEAISDILRGYWPRNRKGIKYYKLAIIKVVDEDGTTIVRTAFDADALVTFDGAKVVEVGQKLKRAMDTQIGNKKKD